MTTMSHCFLHNIRRWMSVGRWGLLLLVMSSCQAQANPQPLSWSEQVDLLRARAVEHSPDALLHQCIIIAPRSYEETLTLAADQSLLVSCDFMRSDGSTFELEFDDLHMQETLKRTKSHSRGGSVESATIQALQRAQGAPQIGPREALVAAQAHSEAFQERVGPIASSSAVLFLGELSVERTKLPAMWSIGHFSFSKESEYIWVSAIDGTVIEREEAEE
ncbi:MAG: hypothetical protein AAGF95_28340 [Chloroflexota bacterium]